MKKGPKAVDPVVRFMRFVEKTDTCWVWTGGTVKSCGDRRYGCFGAGTRLIKPTHVLAHRFSYETFIGPIPHDLTIDHLCRNTLCVNPQHLEAVTQRENIHRGDSGTAINARKTHCKNGHPLSGDNLKVLKNGKRKCVTCSRVWHQQYYQLHKGVKVADRKP